MLLGDSFDGEQMTSQKKHCLTETLKKKVLDQ